MAVDDAWHEVLRKAAEYVDQSDKSQMYLKTGSGGVGQRGPVATAGQGTSTAYAANDGIGSGPLVFGNLPKGTTVTLVHAMLKNLSNKTPQIRGLLFASTQTVTDNSSFNPSDSTTQTELKAVVDFTAYRQLAGQYVCNVDIYQPIKLNDDETSLYLVLQFIGGSYTAASAAENVVDLGFA